MANEFPKLVALIKKWNAADDIGDFDRSDAIHNNIQQIMKRVSFYDVATKGVAYPAIREHFGLA